MSSRLAFQTQLASIMEVLANAAVAEICKLVDDDYAVVSLQMSQCQRENKALKRKLHLLELKMARGTAERRLRESALNNSRLRVQISGLSNDRVREISPSADGEFDQQTVSMWPGRALTAGVSGQLDDPRSASPDVQLVEPEPVIVKEETETEPETKDEVHLIEDNGIMKHVPERPKHSLEISPNASNQIQPTSGTRTSPRAQRRNSATIRGVEEDGEPDVVLVKVEEAEVKHDQTSLIIQEGLVESSTDDIKAGTTNPLQESLPTISEVSFGTTSLWTNDNISDFCPDQNLPGTSSQIPMTNNLSEMSFNPASGLQHFPNFQISHSIATGQLSNRFLAQDQRHSKTKRDKKVRKKNFVCDFCGKRFSSPANLESHLRTHTGEKPFACNICGKKFSQFWNMKIHKNIHTGERPYQCSVCPERFSDPSNLKKHEKRHYSQKNP